MLQDCVYGPQQTLFHDPCVQRPIVSLPRLLAPEGDVLCCEARYLVVHTVRLDSGRLWMRLNGGDAAGR